MTIALLGTVLLFLAVTCPPLVLLARQMAAADANDERQSEVD